MDMKKRLLVLLLLVYFNPPLSKANEAINPEHDQNTDEAISGVMPKPTELEKYKMRFGQYRAMQNQVMKTVFDKAEKKQVGKLIETMVSNLFQVLFSAKSNLTQAGFVPGDPFPEEENTKESLSQVLENLCMFGDVLLRRPTPVHALLDTKQDWRDTLVWAYHVGSQSGVFSTPDLQDYLSTIAQEAGVVPKTADFKNPYLHDSEKPRKRFEDPKPKEKKKSKKLKRGPKMSHVEL